MKDVKDSMTTCKLGGVYGKTSHVSQPWLRAVARSARYSEGARRRVRRYRVSEKPVGSRDA